MAKLETIPTRVSAEEKQRYRLAAEEDGMETSTWLRHLAELRLAEGRMSKLSTSDRILLQGAADMAQMPLADWIFKTCREKARSQAEQQGREDDHDQR
jgi:hypothetical protein